MREPFFRGSAVALVTPFSSKGVNEAVMRELVEFQIGGGTSALVVCGSTGEAATMAPAEQEHAISVVVDAAAGRVPVVAGVGGSDTRVVAGLGRAARGAGADGLLISAPPYNKPTQRGIIAHVRAVLDAADLPAILYNVPGRTVTNILPATVAELADDERIVGVKEACGDIAQISDLACRLEGRLAIYSGNDDQVVPLMALGALGVISVMANLAPQQVAGMTRSFLDGDIAEARRLQLYYLPLIQTLFGEPNPVPVKFALTEMGFEVGEVRLPLVGLEDGSRTRLRAQLAELGLPVQVEARA